MRFIGNVTISISKYFSYCKNSKKAKINEKDKSGAFLSPNIDNELVEFILRVWIIYN